MPEQMELVPAGERLAFRRRPVPEQRLEEALSLLAYFNEQMGTRLSPYKRTGRPSEALSRVLGALADADPPLSREEAETMIRAAAARPWWQGAPGTGVVFGPRTLDRCRELAAGRGRARGSAPARPFSWEQAWEQIRRGDWGAMHPAVQSFCGSPSSAAILAEQGADSRGNAQLGAAWARL